MPGNTLSQYFITGYLLSLVHFIHMKNSIKIQTLRSQLFQNIFLIYFFIDDVLFFIFESKITNPFLFASVIIINNSSSLI